MAGPLSERTALITGASHGLGLEIARAYLQADARGICICGRDRAALRSAELCLREVARPGQGVSAVVADVSLPGEVDRLAAHVREHLGELTILVSNAGVQGPVGRIDSCAWTQWIRTLEINLFGSVLCARAMVPHFIERGYGKIIQVSGGGATKPMPRLSAYAASKAAVVRFAETLAEELREHRVDVNALAPGALNTRMLDEILSAGPKRAGEVQYERALAQQHAGGTPLRLGAELAVFLGSAASDGITGKLLSAVWDSWEQLGAHASDLDLHGDLFTLRRIVPGDRGLSWGARDVG
jgi:NAD(P)-dependent dehydrogenase (short-subunit alcohol dehydrogenase family)